MFNWWKASSSKTAISYADDQQAQLPGSVTPPPSCPMHAATLPASYDTRATKPLSYISGNNEALNKCPVDGVGFNASNQSYTNDNSPLTDSAALPKRRQVSSIPRTPEPSAKSDQQSEEQPEYWVYPSQQQFFNSMKRKNFEPSEDDMAVVVSMHNVVNEMAWRKILEWEHKYRNSCASGPTLKKFGGKSESMSPKDRLLSWLGYAEPFDRHDWIVDRCGTEVRYILDFYQGSGGDERRVSMHIDARPALDSGLAVYDRVEREVYETVDDFSSLLRSFFKI